MILNRQRRVRVSRRALESFLRRVQDELGIGGADVTVCLVSDAEIARMNEKFRKKKGPTDVLAFPQENSFSPLTTRHSPLRSLSNELRVLILHGTLHLLGYDHEADQGQMNRIEQRLRRRFGLK